MFIAASAAFGQLLASLLGLGDAFVEVIRVIPIYERARPLLREMPEILEAHGDPGKLSGAIELRNLSFRYEAATSGHARSVGLEDRARILRRHRRTVGGGKVDACFGCCSASRKPSHGAVLYDGHDLGFGRSRRRPPPDRLGAAIDRRAARHDLREHRRRALHHARPSVGCSPARGDRR